jgi:hypothetical protein
MDLIQPAPNTFLKWIEYMIYPMYLQGGFENYAQEAEGETGSTKDGI